MWTPVLVHSPACSSTRQIPADALNSNHEFADHLSLSLTKIKPERIELRFDGAPDAALRWPLKPHSFLLSAAFHCTVAIGLMRIPGSALFTATPPRPQPRETAAITPKTRIYWVPLKRSLPQVAPSETIPIDNSPAGRVQRPTESIVVHQPDPKPGKQLIWQPETPKPIEREIPLRDMVAVKGKPAPKPFVPPKPVQPASQQPAAITPPEAIRIKPQSLQATVAVSPLPTARPKPKTFIPPPAQQPKLAVNPGVIADAPPSIDAGIARNATVPALGQNIGALPTKRPPAKVFVPPTTKSGGAKGGAPGLIETAPELAAPMGTGATITAAVIGLNPSTISARPPEGSRAAEFSTGPRRGAPAAPNGGGITIPGVSVQGKESGAPAPLPAAPLPANAPRFELQLPPTASSMSAPLRPGSRTVPRLMEARFADRVLYTLVVPRPNLPDYTGDWTIWFSERGASTPGNTQMRAPLPIRKALAAPLKPGQAPTPGAPEGWAQIAAVIGKDGKISNITALPGRAQQIAAKAAADLAAWEFRPATRNGEPIEVEAIIEIFFRVN